MTTKKKKKKSTKAKKTEATAHVADTNTNAPETLAPAPKATKNKSPGNSPIDIKNALSG